MYIIKNPLKQTSNDLAENVPSQKTNFVKKQSQPRRSLGKTSMTIRRAPSSSTSIREGSAYTCKSVIGIFVPFNGR